MSLNPKLSDWRGQRVWLIGASSGIGEATAKLLMQRGARVALTSRSRDALTALADGNALVAAADVTDRASLQAAFDEICAALGGIDMAIVNAGTHQPVRAWELDAASRRKAGAGESGRRDQCRALLAPYFAQRGGGTDRHHRQRRRLRRPADRAGIRRHQGGADQLRRDALPRSRAQRRCGATSSTPASSKRR